MLKPQKSLDEMYLCESYFNRLVNSYENVAGDMNMYYMENIKGRRNLVNIGVNGKMLNFTSKTQHVGLKWFGIESSELF
jgi:hypothetical protein